MQGAWMQMIRLPWPLPALLTWASAWGLYLLLHRSLWALLLACVLATLASVMGRTGWRRVFIAAGFPLSLALGGGMAGDIPTWVWLVLLLLLLAVYPLNAWRDAPLFPTPRNALEGLAPLAPLALGARILDAGCGLGDGLLALRRAYPQAPLEGIEWSWPLRLLCALRCPWARVRQGDIWRTDWGSYGMVYLFQRPESMARAAAKAQAEMAPGAWLVSLEFAVPGVPAHAQWQAPGARTVWVYQLPVKIGKLG